jgi:hypothetical protein
MVNAATPHQTSARRCVMVRAMKSLMRMGKPSFNTNRREHANAAAGISVGHLCETLFPML